MGCNLHIMGRILKCPRSSVVGTHFPIFPMPRFVVFASLLVCVLTLSSCQTLRELASLKEVAFAIDHVGDAQLAGVELNRIRSYQDLSATDILRLTRAVTNKELPMAFTLHLDAENPPENSVQARLVQMDWTLFLDDRETVSGLFDQNIVLAPGVPTDIPISIELDLVTFFGENARDLIELALAIGGQGGEAKRVKLQATPTIDTAIGPIRYPRPITIISRDVGS